MSKSPFGLFQGAVRSFGLVCAALVMLPISARAQDISWAVDEAPGASAVMLKILEKAPSFCAKAEVVLSSKLNPSPSVASGMLYYASGKLRWDVKLTDVKSPELSQNARTVVRQINGDRFLILAPRAMHATYLVLTGAKACLRQVLPDVKLTRTKEPGRVEAIDGRPCTTERWSYTSSGLSPGAITLWKGKSPQGVPCQIQFTHGEQVLKVRFQDIQLVKTPEDRFRVPSGVTQYENMEDLVQSVLLEKMKKKLGLQ